jgi:ankyrin repeat protein
MTPAELIEGVVENDIEGVLAALDEEPALAAARDPRLGSTPLHFAAHRGFGEIVQALLAAGADVHAREQASDTTPLHWAAEGGHRRIAEWLVARGADLEARDAWYGLPPVGWATVVTWAPPFHHDKPATAAWLIAAGARVDAFVAVAQDQADAVRVAAVAPGALSQRLGFVGKEMQPLHFAVSRKLGEMARLLVDLGAALDTRTSWGMSPLALAHKHGQPALADWLRGRGAPEDLATALQRGDLSRMAALLKSDPGRQEAARVLAVTAAAEGLADPLALLLRNGADPNLRVPYLIAELPATATLLHLAAMNGHEAASRVLLDAGAAPSPGAGEGTPTPLHLAAGGGHLATVQALLEAGADVQATESGYGATPSAWAENEERTEVIALLRAHGG